MQYILSGVLHVLFHLIMSTTSCIWFYNYYSLDFTVIMRKIWTLQTLEPSLTQRACEGVGSLQGSSRVGMVDFSFFGSQRSQWREHIYALIFFPPRKIETCCILFTELWRWDSLWPHDQQGPWVTRQSLSTFCQFQNTK